MVSLNEPAAVPSGDEWEHDRVIELLNDESIPNVWDELQEVYLSVLEESDLSEETKYFLRPMKVGLIRRASLAESGSPKEETVFWDKVFWRTTESLREFLAKYGVDDGTIALYEAAEIAHVFPGHSQGYKHCSVGRRGAKTCA